MSTYSIKDKYNQRLKPWFFAFTVCIVANLFLYLLFSMSTKKNTDFSTNHPRIVMLPLENKLISQNLQNIIEWMNDENPTLIASPNIESGYSATLLPNNTLAMQKPEVSPIDYKSVLTKQTFSLDGTAVSIIPVKVMLITDFFNQLTNLQTAFLPESRSYPVVQLNTPYPNVSELYTGLSIPMNIYGLGENNSLIAKLKPDKSTIIELYIPDDKLLLLSGKIIESSGSSELDSIALNNLITKQLSDDIFNTYKGNVLNLKIEWTPLFKKESRKD